MFLFLLILQQSQASSGQIPTPYTAQNRHQVPPGSASGPGVETRELSLVCLRIRRLTMFGRVGIFFAADQELDRLHAAHTTMVNLYYAAAERYNRQRQNNPNDPNLQETLRALDAQLERIRVHKAEVQAREIALGFPPSA